MECEKLRIGSVIICRVHVSQELHNPSISNSYMMHEGGEERRGEEVKKTDLHRESWGLEFQSGQEGEEQRRVKEEERRLNSTMVKKTG